jgi:hypothetical protein
MTTVAARHLRALLDSPAEEPVLYLDTSTDEPTLDVWAGAYVNRHSVILTRVELVDSYGDDLSGALGAGAAENLLPELQATIDAMFAEL